MSQGLRTKVAIGSATPLKYRTARTLHDAFGPYARLHVERTGPVIRDRTIGVVCGLIVIGALAFVAWGG